MHSLFSSSKNEPFDHFFIVHLASLMPDVTIVENLSNRSSGVQIQWDVCTRLGCYLYPTECSLIIKGDDLKTVCFSVFISRCARCIALSFVFHF